jgi:intein/homing endonuclease
VLVILKKNNKLECKKRIGTNSNSRIKIKTISGRIIYRKRDEIITTLRGEIFITDLEKSDKILLDSYELSTEIVNEEKHKVFTILDKDIHLSQDYRKKIPNEKAHLIDQDVKALRKLKLLPLRSNNPKLPILSRILGALFTDGSISKKEAVFTVGCLEDAKKINRDIENLGFKSNAIKKYTGIYKSDERNIEYRVFLVRKGGSFVRYMIFLGAPIGRKSTQKIVFPQWLKNTTKLVKREFLGAFLGGDGPSPWYYKRTGRKDSFKITMTRLSMHKLVAYVPSQVAFFQELAQMFQEFNIKVQNIEINNLDTVSDKKKISIRFTLSKDNIYNLCRNIGYRFCKEKHNRAFFVSEYLSFRRNEIRKRILAINKVMDNCKAGKTKKTIAKDLNISITLVQNIIQRKKGKLNLKQTLPISSWTIDQFLKNTNADILSGQLYIPIETILN